MAKNDRNGRRRYSMVVGAQSGRELLHSDGLTHDERVAQYRGMGYEVVERGTTVVPWYGANETLHWVTMRLIEDSHTWHEVRIYGDGSIRELGGVAYKEARP